jgi:hypothetical protein
MTNPLSANPENRPLLSEQERWEFARKKAAHLPLRPDVGVLSNQDIEAMKAAFIVRFNENLPRTETLFAVAGIGYRMALRDAMITFSAED